MVKIYTRDIYYSDDEPTLDYEIDLDLQVKERKHYTDFLHLISKELYIRNRNIYVKVIDNSYHNTKKYLIIEVSNKAFIVDDDNDYDNIDEHNVSDVICLSDIDNKSFNSEFTSEFVYIEPTTKTKYFIRGHLYSTKREYSRYIKLSPCSKWVVNDIHLLTICRDWTCDETKGFYVDTTDENKSLFRILDKVFEYLDDNDNEYYSYFVFTNTDSKFSEIKKELDNLLLAIL